MAVPGFRARPFLVLPGQAPRASPPRYRGGEAPETSFALSGWGRAALTGMAGLGLFGTLLGCAEDLVSPPQAAAAVRVQEPAAEPAAGTVQTRDEGARSPVQTHQQRPRTVEWATYQGTFHGEVFSFQYPKGWRVSRLFNGFMVTDPRDPKTGAAFYWLSGAGEMTPHVLLRLMARDAGLTDYRLLRSEPDPPGRSPIGPVSGVVEEATYNFQGVPSRGEFHSVVTVNRSPYASLWYASVTTTSAPQEKWQKMKPLLQRIVSSFNADLNQEAAEEGGVQ